MELSGGTGTSVFATSHFHGIPDPPPGFTQAVFKVRWRYDPGGQVNGATAKIGAFDGIAPNFASNGFEILFVAGSDLDWQVTSSLPMSAAEYSAMVSQTIRVAHYHVSGEFANPKPRLFIGKLGVVFT
jgi:hypothetical protein